MIPTNISLYGIDDDEHRPRSDERDVSPLTWASWYQGEIFVSVRSKFRLSDGGSTEKLGVFSDGTVYLNKNSNSVRSGFLTSQTM
jgi:hypothetical protein